MAVIKALNCVIQYQIIGMHVSFFQAVWRKIGCLNLASEYINYSKLNLYFRMFLSLVFVPFEVLDNGFNKIIAS